MKSSTRKLNKLRNATKLTMSMLARERARTSSATKKVTADIETQRLELWALLGAAHTTPRGEGPQGVGLQA